MENQYIARLVISGDPILLDNVDGHPLLLASLEDVTHILRFYVVAQATQRGSTRHRQAADRVIDLHKRDPDRTEVVVRPNEEMVLVRR